MQSPTPTTRSVAPALILGVVAISFAALFFKLAAPTHPIAMSAIRLLLSAALLSPMVLRARRRGEVDARFLKRASAAGIAYAVHFGAWVWSLELTTVAASVTLVTATPLVLAIWSLVRGVDRPTAGVWAALALAAVGVGTIGGVDLLASDTAIYGDALAVLGAGGMAAYMLIVRPMGPIDVLAFTGVAALVGGVLLSLVAIATGISLAPASATALAALLAAALLPQLVGHTALTWSLRHTTPTVVGIATLGEPVGATLLAISFLSEVPSPLTAVGCVITTTAVAVALLSSRRRRRIESRPR